MAEIAVAFPDDEATAEVIASRLRAAGIAARVDRGLSVGYLVPARGELTVAVDANHAKRAREIGLEKTRRRKRAQ